MFYAFVCRARITRSSGNTLGQQTADTDAATTSAGSHLIPHHVMSPSQSARISFAPGSGCVRDTEPGVLFEEHLGAANVAFKFLPTIIGETPVHLDWNEIRQAGRGIFATAVQRCMVRRLESEQNAGKRRPKTLRTETGREIRWGARGECRPKKSHTSEARPVLLQVGAEKSTPTGLKRSPTRGSRALRGCLKLITGHR